MRSWICDKVEGFTSTPLSDCDARTRWSPAPAPASDVVEEVLGGVTDAIRNLEELLELVQDHQDPRQWLLCLAPEVADRRHAEATEQLLPPTDLLAGRLQTQSPNSRSLLDCQHPHVWQPSIGLELDPALEVDQIEFPARPAGT